MVYVVGYTKVVRVEANSLQDAFDKVKENLDYSWLNFVENEDGETIWNYKYER